MKCNRRRFLQYLSAASTALTIGNLNAIPASARHSRIIPSSAESIPVIGMGSWLVFAIDPDNAIDCNNWAQFFLKFIISHPAVTCTIPATSRVDHMRENMGAAYGRLPDTAMRKEMVDYVQSL